MAVDIQRLAAYHHHHSKRQQAPQGPGLRGGQDGGDGTARPLDVPFFRVAECDLDRGKWKDAHFGQGGQSLLKGWTEVVDADDKDDDARPLCISTVQHPVYIIHGIYDQTNLWHSLESVVHAFETYAAWGLAPADVQIVVADHVNPAKLLMPPAQGDASSNNQFDASSANSSSTNAKDFYFGRIGEIWELAFSGKRPATTLQQLATDAARSWAQQQQATGSASSPHETSHRKAGHGSGMAAADELPVGAALCFRQAAFDVHGGVSPLSRAIKRRTACRKAALINGLSDLLVDALGLAAHRPAEVNLAALAGGADANQQPEEGQLDRPREQQGAAQHAAQPQRLIMLWASREGFSRQLLNERELLQAIQEEFGGVLEVKKVHFERLGLRQQVELIRSAHILAGPHGAALAHTLLLPRGSVVLEVEHMWRGEHFYNLAVWRDLYHIRFTHKLQTVHPPYFLLALRLAVSVAGRDIHTLPHEQGCGAEFQEADVSSVRHFDCNGNRVQPMQYVSSNSTDAVV